METPPSPPTTTANGDSFKVTSIKKIPTKIIIILAAILLIIAFVTYYFSLSSTKPGTSVTNNPREQFINQAITNGRFESTRPVAKVGNETLYGNDLNYVLAVNFPDQYQNPNISDSQLKQLGLPLLASQSALLQLANQISPATQINSGVYNSDQKDIWARAQLVQKLTEAYQSQELHFTGKMLTIWYHNVRLPSIPLAQAQQLAKSKIDSLYTRIKSHTLTIDSAANQIRSDSELAKIDPNYKGNALTVFDGATQSNPPFTFSELNQALFQLKSGELSTVIKVPTTATKSTDEEFYAIIQVDKVTNTRNQTLDEWLSENIQKYPITVY